MHGRDGRLQSRDSCAHVLESAVLRRFAPCVSEALPMTSRLQLRDRKGYFVMPYEYLLDENLSADFWTVRLVECPDAARKS